MSSAARDRGSAHTQKLAIQCRAHRRDRATRARERAVRSQRRAYGCRRASRDRRPPRVARRRRRRAHAARWRGCARRAARSCAASDAAHPPRPLMLPRRVEAPSRVIPARARKPRPRRLGALAARASSARAASSLASSGQPGVVTGRSASRRARTARRRPADGAPRPARRAHARRAARRAVGTGMPRGGRRRCVAPMCGSANAQHKIASMSRPVPAMPHGAYENGQAAYQESTPCVGSFMAIWRSGTHGSAHRADRVGESLLAAAERVGMAAAILYITWYPGAATETRLAYVQAVGHCARGPITTAHDRSRTAGGRKVPKTFFLAYILA